MQISTKQPERKKIIMKKKTIAIILAILAVVMCFTLAACGDKTDVEDSLNDGANISDVADATEGEDATDTPEEDDKGGVVEDEDGIK